MRIFRKPALAALLGIAAIAALSRPASAQAVTVTVRSVDALHDAVKYLAKLVGQEAAGAQIEGLVQILGTGIDTTKPIIAYGDIPATPFDPPAAQLTFTSKGETALVDLLKTLEAKPEKLEGGIWTATPPGGVPVFFKFVGNTVHTSNVQAKLNGNLPDPATLVPAEAAGALIAVVIRIDRIPEAYRAVGKSTLDEAVKKAETKMPGEADAEHEGRLAGTKLARDIGVEIIDEAVALSVRLDVDPVQNQTIALDVSLSAKPGSKLAGRFGTLQESRSTFAGWADKSVAVGFVRIPVPASISELAAKAFEAGMRKELAKENNQAKREAGEKVLADILAGVDFTQIDAAFAVRGPNSDGKFNIFGGLKVRDGKRLENAVRTVLSLEKPPADVTLKLDADSYAGANIHHITSTKAPDEGFTKVFGKAEFAAAVRPDMILFSLGSGAGSSIKAALDAATGSAPLITPAMLTEVSLSKLLPIIGQEKAEAAAKIANEVFAGSAAAYDKIRFSLRGGESLRLRWEIHGPVVRAFALLGQGK